MWELKKFSSHINNDYSIYFLCLSMYNILLCCHTLQLTMHFLQSIQSMMYQVLIH